MCFGISKLKKTTVIRSKICYILTKNKQTLTIIIMLAKTKKITKYIGSNQMKFN